MGKSEDEFNAAIESAKNDPTFPSDMTELGSMAAQSHEIWSTHTDAGFSPSQALYLTAVLMTNSPGMPPPC